MAIKLRDIQTAMSVAEQRTKDVFNSNLSEDSIKLINHMVAAGIAIYHIMLRLNIMQKYHIDIGELEYESNELQEYYDSILPKSDS